MPFFEGGNSDSGGGSSIATQLVQNEVPSGSIDGSNLTFATLNAFLPSTLQVFLNGDLQQAGASNDYVEGSGDFTFSIPPKPGDVILLTYIKP